MTIQDAMSAITRHRNSNLDLYRRSMDALVGEALVTEEVGLEPELINSLYRRGRRRLRDIQSNCGVNVWLDKLRGVLHLSGSKESVAAAKNLIAGLGGPRKRVSTAMWAELLRTRKLQSGAEAAVARIQLDSGCRIHVERASQEVHLFGDSVSVEKAEQLLNDLDRNCVEETLSLDTSQINSASLQLLANSCGVTLQTQENEVCILGLRGNVEKAVGTLNEHREDIDSYLEVVAPIVKDETEVKESSKRTSIPVAHKPPKDLSQNADKIVKTSICPTCRACPFCPSCGHPTAFLDSSVASGFATNGNSNMFANLNSTYANTDYNTEAGGYWVWQPSMPSMPQEFAVGDNLSMSSMAFMIPSAQNVPICFVPTTMVPNRHP